jgi:tetratricopeptide (TPR) repeat protein
MFGRRVLLCVSLVLAGAAARARAQDDAAVTHVSSPADQPPAAYAAAADLGFQEFEQGNYAEARARFLEAHRLWPNARSLRALGQCEYELRNYVAAIDLLQQALASAVRPLLGESRTDAEQLLRQARAYVARYQLETKPRDVRILIDGVDTVLDASGAVLLGVGPHILEVQAEGYQPRRRELQVEGNADRLIPIELQPVTRRAAIDPHDEPLHKKWWLWASVATVVAAGVATGLAVALHHPEPEPASGGSSGIVINVRKPTEAP